MAENSNSDEIARLRNNISGEIIRLAKLIPPEQARELNNFHNRFREMMNTLDESYRTDS